MGLIVGTGVGVGFQKGTLLNHFYTDYRAMVLADLGGINNQSATNYYLSQVHKIGIYDSIKLGYLSYGGNKLRLSSPDYYNTKGYNFKNTEAEYSKYVFSGITSYDFITIPTLPTLGTGDFSIIMNVNVKDLSNIKSLIGGVTNSFSLFITTDGILSINKTGIGNPSAAASEALLMNTDYTVGYVREGTTGTYYINGISAGTCLDTLDYSVGCTRIGIYDEATNYPFSGFISLCRMFNISLTSSQVNTFSNPYSVVSSDSCILDLTQYGMNQKSWVDKTNNITTTLAGSTFLDTNENLIQSLESEQPLFDVVNVNNDSETKSLVFTPQKYTSAQSWSLSLGINWYGSVNDKSAIIGNGSDTLSNIMLRVGGVNRFAFQNESGVTVYGVSGGTTGLIGLNKLITFNAKGSSLDIYIDGVFAETLTVNTDFIFSQLMSVMATDGGEFYGWLICSILRDGNLTIDQIMQEYNVFSSYFSSLNRKFYNVNLSSFSQLGDSWTSANEFQPIVIRNLGITESINLGITGSELSKRVGQGVVPMVDRYLDVPIDTDLTIIMGGINDSATNNPLGVLGIKDSYTFIGAYQIIIEGLLNRNPLTKIMLVTPSKYWNYAEPREANADVRSYADATITVAEFYNIPVLDLDPILGLNETTKYILMGDLVHLNAFGYYRLGRLISEFIKNNF